MKQFIFWKQCIPFIIGLLLTASCNKDALNRIDHEALFDLAVTELFDSASQELYYWHGDEKIYFELDQSLALVEIQGGTPEQYSNFMPDNKVVAIRMEDENTLQLIASAENALRVFDRHKDHNHVNGVYTAIKTRGGATAFITNKISITFPENINQTDVDDIARRYHLSLVKETTYGAHLFRANDASQTLKIANTIQESEKVLWSSPDFVMIIKKNTDTLYPLQYYLNNTGQGGGTFNIDINAPEAWNITTGCNNIRVAVIDDGIDAHDEFTGRLLSGFTAGPSNTFGAPLDHQDKGHGVNCAGIIAAAHNNGEGIKGIAPNALLIPVNIFPYAPNMNNQSGAASTSDIALAIEWAWAPAGGNADILSNSWGGAAEHIDITTQINNARTLGRGGLGAIVVAATGNFHPDPMMYPANLSGVIAVGAIDRNGNIWNYSQRGSQMNLVAPSGQPGNMGDVVTTDRMGAWGVSSGDFSHVFGGTSAACPQVAGVAALMLSVNPSLSETQVRTTLQNTATDMGPSGFDNTFGYGRVNAFAALRSFFPNQISGPNTPLCSGAGHTYTISNLPNGATVTWNVSPNGLVSSNANGNIAILTRVGSSRGMITLSATINISCGTLTLTKQIYVGPLNENQLEVIGALNIPNAMTPGIFGATFLGHDICTIELGSEVTGLPDFGIQELEWSVPNANVITEENVICPFSMIPGSSIAVTFPSSGLYHISFRVRNVCGWSGWTQPKIITVN